MKKLNKQILVAVFLAILVTTQTANAGFLEWLTGSKAQTQTASEGSFDQLYASLTDSSDSGADQTITIGNAVVSVSTPAGGISKTLRRNYTVQVSGYNSEVGQTDASPFIMADGNHVYDGAVASNMFPFGTIIKFKNCGGIDPNKIFVVEDRMNTRYQHNVDIWFADHSVAVKFGRRTCQIEVIQ